METGDIQTEEGKLLRKKHEGSYANSQFATGWSSMEYSCDLINFDYIIN